MTSFVSRIVRANTILYKRSQSQAIAQLVRQLSITTTGARDRCLLVELLVLLVGVDAAHRHEHLLVVASHLAVDEVVQARLVVAHERHLDARQVDLKTGQRLTSHCASRGGRTWTYA